MPGFRRWSKSRFQKKPESSFKLLAAVLIITLYLIIKEFSSPPIHVPNSYNIGAEIQFKDWKNGTEHADTEKATAVRDAMKYTFWKYRQNAWGWDDIGPVSGEGRSSRNGWGAFIVDASTTLALMGLYDELALCVQHIIAIDFTKTEDLVDPFETTIRYLGGLVSLVDLADGGLIPKNIIDAEAREMILRQAVTLANSLGPAYDTPTGMPYPRVNFNTSQGVPDPPSVYLEHPERPRYDNPVIGPARTGSSILEARTLTRLTGDPIYARNATLAWAPLVWSKYITPWKGMIDAPIDIITGAPVGRQRHWDGGHDSYYEYLLKMSLLSPPTDPYIKDYKTRFLEAATSLREHLTSRSAPAPGHTMQHLFIGRQDAQWFLNTQSHLSCFAPGTLLLASKLYPDASLHTFALALLEACHHTYTSTPTNIGPESWSWVPKFGYDDPIHLPLTPRQKSEWKESGFWATDPAYKGRPEYVESLFYAWRITGQGRYREWAWEAFQAMERHCKAPFGYAGLVDVYEKGDGDGKGWVDTQESFWAAETLKYAWLTFAAKEVASLDRWVFSTEGHLFRMIR